MSDDLALRCLSRVPLSAMMRNLAQIAAYDRYQASRGIEEVATRVAEEAAASGLEHVSVTSFPADGTMRWWSFRAPVSWTPTAARFELRNGGGEAFVLDHARSPFAIATYSAPTPPSGVTTRLVDFDVSHPNDGLRGAIAVVAKADYRLADVAPALVACGALGFVTDALSRRAEDGEHRGRIELEPRSPLFAFSLTMQELDLIRAGAERGSLAHALVAVDRSAAMPVVTGLLPGEDPHDEVWLTAHLCHPRPGANDNASGAAALLGVAAALHAARSDVSRGALRKSIRFCWGPEYLGVAAMLHARRDARPPSAVINLDMVGDDQARSGGPFIVERGPDSRTALITPLAEHVVARIFEHTRAEPGTWRPAQFSGLSDHALFADSRTGAPAVHLCHEGDRFNHSAGDTLENVSAVEVLRAASAAAAIASLAAGDPALSRSAVRRIVLDWTRREESAARRIAARYQGRWAQRFLAHVDRGNAAMLALAESGENQRLREDDDPSTFAEPPLRRSWPGPFNARAMVAEVPARSRRAVERALEARKNSYAMLNTMANAVDGRRGRSAVLEHMSFALRRPVGDGDAELLLGAMVESGWIAEG